MHKSDTSHRIRKIMDYYHISVPAFSEIIGVAPQNVYSILSGKRVAGEGVLNKILLSYDSISKDWLFEGSGDMFTSDEEVFEIVEQQDGTFKYRLIVNGLRLTSEKSFDTIHECEEIIKKLHPTKKTKIKYIDRESKSKSSFEPNATFIDNPNYIMVSVVGQYAAAGYMSGFADEEYIQELPKVPFFVNHAVKGKYMGFEVRGDSMDDNSVNSIVEGDTLICRQIKPELWHHKLHIQKWFFVIVHKEDGILVKQIIDHNTDTGDITIHSLNSFYPDQVLNLKDVAQLFNVVQISRIPRL